MFGSFPATIGSTNSSPTEEVKAAPTTEESLDKVEGENVQESATEEKAEGNVDQEATNQDEVSENNNEENVDESTDEDKKPKRGFAKRIEKFNQKLSAKEQEIEYWRQLALKNQQAEQPQAQQNVPQGKPKFDDYSSIEEYTEALTDWKLNNTLSQVQQQNQMRQVQQNYDSRLEKFKTEVKDFDDVMAEFVEDYGSIDAPEIIQVAYDSEVGPQLAYHLAKNPHIVETLLKLPSHRRLVELGKLEDRLSQPKESVKEQPKVEVKKVSTASKPVEPVKGKGKVETDDLTDPNLSYKEWVKRREASLKRR